jgi:hypothetical protein
MSLKNSLPNIDAVEPKSLNYLQNIIPLITVEHEILKSTKYNLIAILLLTYFRAHWFILVLSIYKFKHLLTPRIALVVGLASLLPPAPPAENGLHGNGKIPHKTSKAKTKQLISFIWESILSPLSQVWKWKCQKKNM